MRIATTEVGIREFNRCVELLNKNTYDDVKNFTECMIKVMNDSGVSEYFDYKQMALSAVRHSLKQRIDDLDKMEFEVFTVGNIITEITRPKGS